MSASYTSNIGTLDKVLFTYVMLLRALLAVQPCRSLHIDSSIDSVFVSYRITATTDCAISKDEASCMQTRLIICCSLGLKSQIIQIWPKYFAYYCKAAFHLSAYQFYCLKPFLNAVDFSLMMIAAREGRMKTRVTKKQYRHLPTLESAHGKLLPASETTPLPPPQK